MLLLRLAFQTIDRFLYRAVQAMAETLTVPGLIDVDFADIRQMTFRKGLGALGFGRGRGEGRAVAAARAALACATLGIALDRAESGLFIARGGADLSLGEVVEAAELVYGAAHPDATFLSDVHIDPSMAGEVESVLVATGIGAVPAARAAPLGAADGFSGIGKPGREAEERAEEVVRSVLGEEEYDRMHRLGYLEVPSPSFPQRVYRVPVRPGPVQMLEGSRCVGRLCVVPTVPIPGREVVVVHKLMIEGAEQEYLRVANQLPP